MVVQLALADVQALGDLIFCEGAPDNTAGRSRERGLGIGSLVRVAVPIRELRFVFRVRRADGVDGSSPD